VNNLTLIEAAVICVAIIAATVASILGSLTPPLVGLLGVAVGYGGGRTVSLISNTEKKP
jgi:hypothetical protein